MVPPPPGPTFSHFHWYFPILWAFSESFFWAFIKRYGCLMLRQEHLVRNGPLKLAVPRIRKPPHLHRLNLKQAVERGSGLHLHPLPQVPAPGKASCELQFKSSERMLQTWQRASCPIRSSKKKMLWQRKTGSSEQLYRGESKIVLSSSKIPRQAALPWGHSCDLHNGAIGTGMMTCGSRQGFCVPG